MKVDAHVYAGQSIFGYEHKKDEILKKMEALEIDRCILCPVKPFGYHLGPENDFISKIVKDHRDRFTGFVRVDPRQGKDALNEMIRGIEMLELAGLYLNPWEETCEVNSELVYPLMQRAGEYKMPVMIKGGHQAVSHPSQIHDIALRFPMVKIIATSGGQINISGGALEDARLLLEKNRNVYMETSGIYREDFIEEMTRVIGADRLIFGSGSPVLDMAFEIERIRKAKILDGEKKTIMGDSINALLNWR